jgi:hypothetical protein
MGPTEPLLDTAQLPIQLLNASGRDLARLASTNDLPVTLNLYHNDDFIFRNPFRFKEREGLDKFLEGKGELQLRGPA